jgi:hypothetical protein
LDVVQVDKHCRHFVASSIRWWIERCCLMMMKICVVVWCVAVDTLDIVVQRNALHPGRNCIECKDLKTNRLHPVEITKIRENTRRQNTKRREKQKNDLFFLKYLHCVGKNKTQKTKKGESHYYNLRRKRKEPDCLQRRHCVYMCRPRRWYPNRVSNHHHII